MGFLLLLPLLSVCLMSCSGTTSGETVVRVKEGSEAVLPCLIRPERNITGDVFDWKKDGQKDEKQEVFMYNQGLHYNNGLPGQDEQFKGRISHFPDQLQSGNASIVIRDTKLSDSGNYTCVFSPDQPNRQTFYIKLLVDCILKDRSEENIPAACPKPIITTHEAAEDLALLQCDVQGAFPKPTVKWQDSDGKKITAEEPKITERDGRFYITLNTTATKTGDFYCVATQIDICHQLSTKTYIPGLPIGWIVAGVLLIVVGGAVLYKKGSVIINCIQGS